MALYTADPFNLTIFYYHIQTDISNLGVDVREHFNLLMHALNCHPPDLSFLYTQSLFLASRWGLNTGSEVEFCHPAVYSHLDHYTMKTNLKGLVPVAHLMWHYTLQTYSTSHFPIIIKHLSFLTLVLV